MSAGRRLHGKIRAELAVLAARGMLTGEQVALLRERYPVTAWDGLALVRAFTILGALTAIAGLVILVREHVNWWLVSEAGLAVAGVALIALGFALRTRRALPVLGDSVQLLGAMALHGLIVVLAVHHATDSGNWPALAGTGAFAMLVLAYALANRLVLWYGLANAFFWFGAETGYVSGWGVYWLGMTWPLRYLGIGLATLGLAWLHAALLRGPWAGFSRVYAHWGLLVGNLALWFLALFGYYEDYDSPWSDAQGERLAWTLAWAGVAGASLWAGATRGIRLLRGYGLTFLVINAYTFYFQFVVAESGGFWFVHLLLTGGSLLWLGRHIERGRAGA